LEADFGYAGLFHHGPSGLDLATYRVYDSTMGRWISREPLGEGVDYNLYRYANNSPISFRDSSGLLPEDTPAYTGPVNQQTEAPWVANRPGPLDTLLVAGAAEVGIATAGAVATYGVMPGLGLAGAQVGESAMALGLAVAGALPRGPLYGGSGYSGPGRIQSRGGFAKQGGNEFRQQAQQRGRELLEEAKATGVGGNSGKSGGHGTPYLRAGAELIREANKRPKNCPLKDAMKIEGERLLNQGRGHNHK
jgi:RHS repeat-associated protein